MTTETVPARAVRKIRIVNEQRGIDVFTRLFLDDKPFDGVVTRVVIDKRANNGMFTVELDLQGVDIEVDGLAVLTTTQEKP